MLIDQRAIFASAGGIAATRNDQAFSVVPFARARRSDRHLPAESDDIALRVELLMKVERLSLFDPLTGQVESTVPRYTIYPKTLRDARAYSAGDGRDKR